MDIYTLDGLDRGFIIEKYSSVVWTKQYFGPDDFQLVVPGTAENVALLVRGVMLVRDMDIQSDGFKNVMIIERRTLRWDAERGWVMTLTGRGLKSILGRRVVWSQLNLSGTVEAGIRQAITDNVIEPELQERVMPNVAMAPAAGITDTWEAQVFGERLDTWVEDVGRTYGIGWDAYISGGQILIALYKGTDRSADQTTVEPVIFSPEYDNLAEAGLDDNGEEYYNAAIVGGEGEGTSQRVAVVGTASGMSRIERYIDGSGVSSNGEIITPAQYTQLLQTYGEEQLAIARTRIKYDGKIIKNQMYELGRDYALGDIVTIKNDYGIQQNCRITEMIHCIDDAGEDLVPTFEAVDEEVG